MNRQPCAPPVDCTFWDLALSGSLANGCWVEGADMVVECVIEDDRWLALDLDGCATIAITATLQHLGLGATGFEVGLLGCDDGRIAVLNADFRAKGSATNVLSWPSQERGARDAGHQPAPPDPNDPELGDIAIAYDTCAREAAAGNLAIKDHVTHLLVHATLHLLGYDHERDADATLMEGLETEILGKLGLADPYRQ